MRVGVINIPTKVGRTAWEECFRRTATRCCVFGINEAFAPRAKALYQDLAEELGLQYVGLWSPNPVFWDRTLYRFKFARQIKLHGRAPGRKARRWPGYNAERSAMVVILEPRTGSGPEVAFINWHRTPRGPKVNAAWRLWAWAVSNAKIRAVIRRQRREGRITWVVGDTNQQRPFPLAGVTWLRSNGVDKVGVAVPPGIRLGSRAAVRFPAPTDHKHGICAVAAFHRKSS